MKIDYLKIDDNEFTFNGKNILIFSTENSKGKTSLIRCLLYSMGYNIPSTKGMNMGKLNLETKINVGNQDIIINRNNNNLVVNKKEVFNMQEYGAREEVLNRIYGVDNPYILDNILGLHYFDQEKGWTLLNRGSVIGSIKFKIENLIAGLSDIDISDLNEETESLKRERDIYSNVASLIELRSDYNNENYESEETVTKLSDKLHGLSLEIKMLKKSIKEYKEIRDVNDKLINLIESAGISVQLNDGTVVDVTHDNIVNINPNQNLINILIEKKTRQLHSKQKEKRLLSKKLDEKMTLVSVESQMDKIKGLVDNISISASQIENLKADYKTKISVNNKKIRKTLYTSDVTTIIFNRIKNYSMILGIEGSLEGDSDFIFTSNLKQYSGAKLHLLVFAFRMALLKEVQEKCNVTLPIILDSPMTGELDHENMSNIFDLLSQEFKDNQVIICSIYKLNEYENSCIDNVITLNGMLLDCDYTLS